MNEDEEMIKMQKMITVLKHKIVMSFLALDLDLQLLAEIDDPRGRANGAREIRYKQSLADKLACARGLVRDEIEVPIWGTILPLIGLGQEGNDEEDAPIAQFLECWDAILSEGREEIALSELRLSTGQSFHDWLCQLEEALSDLRDRVS